MSWRQFWCIALLINVPVFIFLLVTVPKKIPLSVFMLISALAFAIITLILMFLCHIILYIRAKWKGELDPMPKEGRWTLLITGILWFFMILIFLAVRDGLRNEVIGHISFVIFAFWIIGTFASFGFICMELFKYKSIGRRKEKQEDHDNNQDYPLNQAEAYANLQKQATQERNRKRGVV
ncbi:MAG: hypothetical protein AAF228_08485 [Pseudomonadota bacterium]